MCFLHFYYQLCIPDSSREMMIYSRAQKRKFREGGIINNANSKARRCGRRAEAVSFNLIIIFKISSNFVITAHNFVR